MSATLTATIDRSLTIHPRLLACQGEMAVALTVNVDTDIRALASGKNAYLYFLLPNGGTFYKGEYDASSGSFGVTLGFTDHVLSYAGKAFVQLVIADDAPSDATEMWKTEMCSFIIAPSISAVLPASHYTVPAVTVPTTFPAENVILGDSSSAIVARNVEDALQEMVSFNTKTLSQIDFIDFIKRRSRHYSAMAYQKVSSTLHRIILSDDTRHITYSFQKDANDDFVRIYQCYSGAVVDSLYDYDIAAEADLTGTWILLNANNYTVTPTDYFTLASKGAELRLQHYVETRGGLWSIVIDGTTTVLVSCYATVGALITTTLVSGLDPNVTHTIVGTFLGDDPDHAPSASPSRGYVYAGAPGTLAGYVSIGVNSYIISEGFSNKEFAYSVSRGGNTNWIPEHNAIGSAFAITPMEIYLDNVLVDTTLLADGHYIPIDSFELKQSLYGRMAVTSVNVLQIETSHKIGSDGVLSFTGTLEALEAITITGYSLMLPADTNYANTFVTGILNELVNTGDNTYAYFTEEADRVYSGAVISATNLNIIGATTLAYPAKSYRVGKSGKPLLGKDMFIWNRPDVPKLYFQSFLSYPMPQGEIYAWGYDFAISEIDNVYHLIKP
jgi:hypothetical protein